MDNVFVEHDNKVLFLSVQVVYVYIYHSYHKKSGKEGGGSVLSYVPSPPLVEERGRRAITPESIHFFFHKV